MTFSELGCVVVVSITGSFLGFGFCLLAAAPTKRGGWRYLLDSTDPPVKLLKESPGNSSGQASEGKA